MKTLIVLGMVTILALSGCSRAGRANGEIAKACLVSGRDAATPALCNCVQTAANQTLSAADQRLAITFFEDPQNAQDLRQSNNSRHESAWQRYKNFVATAEALCRA